MSLSGVNFDFSRLTPRIFFELVNHGPFESLIADRHYFVYSASIGSMFVRQKCSAIDRSRSRTQGSKSGLQNLHIKNT